MKLLNWLLDIPEDKLLVNSRQVRLLHALTLATIFASYPGMILIFPEHALQPSLAVGVLVFMALVLISRGLLSRRYLFAAATVYLAALLSFLSFVKIAVPDSAKLMEDSFMPVVFLSGMLLGSWGGYLMAAVLMILGFWINVVVAPGTPLTQILVEELRFHGVLYLLTAVLAHIATDNYRRALARVEQQQYDLQARNLELQVTRASMERFAEERIQEVERQKQFYEALVASSPTAVVTLDHQEKIVSCNVAFLELFGYRMEDVLGRNLDELITTPITRRESRAITADVLSGKPVRNTVRRRRKDGTLLDVEVFGVPVHVDGRHVGALAIYQDITERLRAERALRLSEERFRNFFENAAIGLVMVGLDQCFIHVNPAFCQMTGFTREVLLQTTSLAITHPDDQQCDAGMLERLIRKEVDAVQYEKRYLNKDGQVVWASVNASVVRDRDGEPYQLIAQIQDITDLKLVQQRLEHMATHDALTSLPNRVLFFDRLNHAIEVSRRTGEGISVVYMDLDNFKHVNDDYGHQTGDMVLVEVAQRLQKVCRQSDTVARMGGDEFTLILEQACSPQEVSIVINKVLRAVAQPYSVGGNHIHITTSIGYSLFPQDGSSADELLSCADAAMYQNKARFTVVKRRETADLGSRAV